MRAHVGGTLENTLLERSDGAFAHLLGLKCLLRLGHLLDGLFQRAFLRLATIEQARLVEMNVGLDEAGRDQPALGVDLLSFRREVRLDGSDAAALDPDVDRRPPLVAGDASVSEDQIHGVLPSIWPGHP